MRLKFTLSNLRISTKLLLLNLMIYAAFFLIACIIVISFAIVLNMSTTITNRDMGRVIANSKTARELSKVFTDIDQLSNTFYGKDDYLESEGSRLAGIVKDIAKNATDSDLKGSLLDVSNRFESFLSQCSVANKVLHVRESIDRETHAELTRLENLIGELLVEFTLKGEEVSFVEQQLALVIGYRESLLQSGKLYAELKHEHFFIPLGVKTHPMITAIDDLLLRLQALTASTPDITRYGKKILANVQSYKEAIFRLHEVMEELGLRMTDLNRSKASSLSAMEGIDKKISSTTQRVNNSIVKIIYSSGAVVLILSIIVIISLGFGRAYLFRSIINDPMKAILKGVESFRKGNLETQITLNREDEWKKIETALNNMADNLLKSYTSLQESEMRYRDLYEEAPMGYMEYDKEGRITRVNQKELAMLGWTSKGMIGKPVWNFTAEKEKAQKLIKEKLAGDQPPSKNLECSYRRKDGTTFPALIEDVILKDKTGRIIGIRAIIQNITKLKNVEQDKKRLEVQLQQARMMESIYTLAGGISHDFKNILTQILGYTDLCQDFAEPGGELDEFLSEIEKSCVRAKGLVKLFILFSNQEPPVKTIRSITKLIEDTTTLTLSDSNITCEFSLPDDLCKVAFDKSLMKHVIAVLITNADEAMPEGGTIRVSAQNITLESEIKKLNPILKEEKYVKISIQDHGKGIPEENLSKLFDPYFSTKERGVQKGMGIGLSIAYSIVDRHGGKINIKSKMGKGTIVNIYLPAFEIESSSS